MFSWFKKKDDAIEAEYMDMKDYNKENKYKVKFFRLVDGSELEDIKKSVVEGKTICMVNIGLCDDRDLLKRSIGNLKEVCTTFDASIVAFQQNVVLITPKTVDIVRENSGNDNPNNGMSVQ